MSIANLLVPNHYNLFANSITTNLTSTSDDINVFDYMTPVQKADVIARTALLDVTVPINNAILHASAIGGGGVFFPNGTYLIEGTINASFSDVTLEGSGIGATVLQFNNLALDCISIEGTLADQIFRINVTNFQFNYSGKTGGQAIKAHYAHNLGITNIASYQAWSLFDFFVNNTIRISNIYADGITGGAGAFAISWKAPSDGSARSDIIFIDDFIANGHYSGADGIVWDGLANSLSTSDCYLLQFAFPVIINNTGVVPNNVPLFATFNNLQIEGASSSAIQINAGGYYKFMGCHIINESGQAGQGNADTYALAIGPDLAGSLTRGIKFIGCTIGNSKQGAVFCNAKGVDFLQCDFIANPSTDVNAFAAISIGANAEDVTVIGCRSALFGTSHTWKNGLIADVGAVRILESYNNWTFAMTKEVQWNTLDQVSYAGSDIGSNQNTSNNSPVAIINDLPVAGGFVATGPEMLGNVLVLSGTPGGPFNLTTPTSALMVQSLESPSRNKLVDLLVSNTTGQTMTLIAGAGVTLTLSSATLATGQSKVYKLYFTNVAAGTETVTIYG